MILITRENQELPLGGPCVGRGRLIAPNDVTLPVSPGGVLPCAAVFYPCLALNDYAGIDDNGVCRKQVCGILPLPPLDSCRRYLISQPGYQVEAGVPPWGDNHTLQASAPPHQRGPRSPADLPR